MASYVVTGASRGIGLEFVRQLCAIPENKVFAIVRNKAAALAAPSFPIRDNVHVIEADVTDHAALKRAAAQVAEVTGGSLDVLINNAAVLMGENEWRSLVDFDGEDELLQHEFDSTFKVNLMGVIYSTNSFLPLLRNGTTKKVVTISSKGGIVDFVLKNNLAEMVAYSASKAAVNMIVIKYAIKLRDEGFTCVALSPGLVDTNGTREIPSKTLEWFMHNVKDNLKASSSQDALTMITPEISVKKQLDLISKSTCNENGAFLRISED